MLQFHCNTQSTDRIALIRETSICNYVLIIHTPRLCTISLFLDANADSQGESNTIECRPVVSKLNSASPIESPTQLVLDSASLPLAEGVIDDDTPREPEFEVRFADFLKQPLAMDDDDGEMLTLVYDAETGEVESLVRDDVHDEQDAVKPTTAGLETLAKLVRRSAPSCAAVSRLTRRADRCSKLFKTRYEKRRRTIRGQIIRNRNRNRKRKSRKRNKPAAFATSSPL